MEVIYRLVAGLRSYIYKNGALEAKDWRWTQQRPERQDHELELEWVL